MKKVYFLFFFLLSYTAYSQSLSVFSIDPSSFPTMKANFYAFDSYNKQIYDIKPTDFVVKENGVIRTQKMVWCPTPRKPDTLSSVLVIDVSLSMKEKFLAIAQAAAKAWVELLPADQSECAITSFSDFNYLNQDFTTDKEKLITGINSLTCVHNTNYNAAFIDQKAGGILIARTGKYKRVIVMLTDGRPQVDPDTVRIIREAQENNITIYCVTIGMPAPKCLVDIANTTGGLFFENIKTQEQAEDCYRRILMDALGDKPCQLEWQSELSCVDIATNLEISLKLNNTKVTTTYQTPKNKIAAIEIKPDVLKIYNSPIGIQKDTIINIKAINTNINVTDIKSSNAFFTVSPKKFLLSAGESKDVTVSFTPIDSSYQYSLFTVENGVCNATFNVTACYKNEKSIARTLQITHPNGGELFVTGGDTVITWTGILPTDTVDLDYSFDNGSSWIHLADTATGLKYIWRNIPRVQSKNCLIRAIFDKRSFSKCENDELIVVDQIWMCKNLDVDTYSNGDPIPEVKDSAEWRNLKTGAWCYYNNDPAFGDVFGKLYNLMAITDPRGLAPSGWHVPTQEEWDKLSKYVGGNSIGGAKLKSQGTSQNGDGLWDAPNTGATNESGFSALPGGYRYWGGNFMDFRKYAHFWSSTLYDTVRSSDYSLYYDSKHIRDVGSYQNNGLSVRCISNYSYNYIQIDTTDAVFTIEIPISKIQDIDMKKCLAGRAKDSVITDFIQNIGQCAFSVDSIYFQGKDKLAFSLVSGFPKFTVESGLTAEIEICFRPFKFGVHNAEIVVITQADTLIGKITGEGMEQYVLVVNKIIDFGKVPVGFAKDTIQVITIKNLSDKKIHISDTKHNKPNDYDFKNGNIGGFDLEPHEIKKMDLRFEPSDVGRTSGVLEFYYNSEGSPAVIQLYGEGVKLEPQELTGPVNDTINIPIDCQLKWKPNTANTSYTLQIAKDVNFTDMAIDTTVDETYFNCDKLDFFQLYNWRVKAGKINDPSEWSPVWRFTTLMDSVKLTFPADLSKNNDLLAGMVWEQGIYDKDYRVLLSTKSDFKDIDVNDPVYVEHNNSVIPTGLNYFKNYFWKVRNESGDTLGYWSETWQFKTCMSNIGLIYPVNGQTGLEQEINFKWNDVIGAEYYQLQISKNDEFTDLVYSKDSITTTEKLVPALEPEVKYFWRVRVWNEESIGTAFWSEVWIFTTGAAGVKDESEYIKITPNPAGDFITIKLGRCATPPRCGTSGEITIYNTFGEKVLSVGTGRDLPVRINITDLPKGIYFVKVGVETAKFIKL